MKEFLIRLIYCEMLGHEVGFGYIHAINTTQQANMVDKRVGASALSVCHVCADHTKATSLLRSSFTRSTSYCCS